MAHGTLGRRSPNAGLGALVFILLVLPLYLLTMAMVDEVNVDVRPAAMPAWHLVQHGTVDLDGFDTDGNPWVSRTSEGRVMSNRPLALSLLAVPAYLLTNDSSYNPIRRR